MNSIIGKRENGPLIWNFASSDMRGVNMKVTMKSGILFFLN